MSRGPSRPAAHIKPGESSKATAERKRPAAAKRSFLLCRRRTGVLDPKRLEGIDRIQIYSRASSDPKEFPEYDE